MEEVITRITVNHVDGFRQQIRGISLPYLNCRKNAISPSDIIIANHFFNVSLDNEFL